VLVVIDTNVLLVSVSSRSKYHWLYQAILEQKIQIAFTNEILTEYEEQLSTHWNSTVASNVIRSLTELATSLHITVYYNLDIIKTDVDDNKFVDCAFAANAEYIVTNDSHFNILKTIGFPSIPVINIVAFKELLESKKLI